MNRKVVKCTITMLCLAAAWRGRVQADDLPPDRIKKLEDAVQQLQQQNEVLRTELDQVKTQAVVEPAATNGFAQFIIPFAKDKKVVLGGYVQGQGEFGGVDAYRGSFVDTAANNHRVYDRFRLRRARLGAWGDLNDEFDFKIMGDFEQGDGVNSGNGGLNGSGNRTAFSGTDIFINYHQFAEANVKFGQFDTPFGMEQFMIPDMFTLTPERSAVTEALRPERQLGVMLWGKPLADLWPEQKDLVTYWFGIFNGNNRNVTVNDNSSFMYMGRVEAQPFQGQFLGQPTSWKIGVDGYFSSDATNTLLTQTGNVVVGADGRLSGLSVQTKDSYRQAGGVDQRFECGPLTIQAEYLQTQYDHALAKVPHFTANGYWALAAYQIVPKKLELVCKWESFTPDNGMVGGKRTPDDLQTVTGGINYYPKGRDSRDIVLMLDYMHTWSHFRELHPVYGPSDFDEVMFRSEFNF